MPKLFLDLDGVIINTNKFIQETIKNSGVDISIKEVFVELCKSFPWNSFLDQCDEINNSFERGYFLHLLTDYLFYNRYIDKISEKIYNDYDVLNDALIEKYHVVLPAKIKNQVFSKEGTLYILSMELLDKLIEEISNMDLEKVSDEVKKHPTEWTRMRKLRRL